MYLGTRITAGEKGDPANPYGSTCWTATFQPSDFRIQQKFLVKHISLLGPPNSSVDVYIDTTFFDTTPRGDRNSWDPAQPLPLHPGQSVYFYWNSADTTRTPTVSVFCYTDSVV